jgi:hypothetical protein
VLQASRSLGSSTDHSVGRDFVPRALRAHGDPSVSILTALLGVQPDVPGGSISLAPLAAPTQLRRVAGLRVGGQRIAMDIDPDGNCRLTGAPSGVRAVGPLPSGAT